MRDLARVDTVLRAVDVDWVTVWRLLAEEMLRVTELVVPVVRVAGVAVLLLLVLIIHVYTSIAC
jgi:hypothetical protein